MAGAPCADGVAIVGFPDWDGDCHNAAAVLADGRVQAVYRKRFLPNYGVFDEARYFAAGRRPDGARGLRPAHRPRRSARTSGTRARSPADLAAARVDLVCCISASPYHRGKGDRREGMLATRADDCAAALAFCNQVGGQDELVFDGRSAVFDATGEVLARAPQFARAPAGGRHRPRRLGAGAACASRSAAASRGRRPS